MSQLEKENTADRRDKDEKKPQRGGGRLRQCRSQARGAFSLWSGHLCPEGSACPAGSWLRRHLPRGHSPAPPRTGSWSSFVNSRAACAYPHHSVSGQSCGVSSNVTAVFPELRSGLQRMLLDRSLERKGAQVGKPLAGVGQEAQNWRSLCGSP